MKSSLEYYRMREILLRHGEWPMVYLFKFIVPNDKAKLEAVKKILPDPEKVSYRVSKDIRYIGISSKNVMYSPEAVLEIYEKVQKIDGVISL